MADEVTLLDFWASSFCMRVRIALALKEIDYDFKEENLTKKSPLLLKMNPIHKKIPVLIHNGKPVCESLIIVQYIDEVWNNKYPLLPSDPCQRAQARFWADYTNKVHENGKKVRTSKGEEQEELAKKDFIECLKVLEGELGEKTYFGGEKLGYVDVSLLPFYCWFYSIELLGNISIEKECPKLEAWVKKCLENDTVSKAMPDKHKFYEFFLEKRKLGI